MNRKPPAPILPRPDERAMRPHPDDWAAWCAHPVTRFVATAMLRSALAQRDAWFDISWTGGNADPAALAVLHTRADAYMALLETPLESYAKLIET